MVTSNVDVVYDGHVSPSVTMLISVCLKQIISVGLAYRGGTPNPVSLFVYFFLAILGNRVLLVSVLWQ